MKRNDEKDAFRCPLPEEESEGAHICPVRIWKLSIPAQGHSLYAELLLPEGIDGKLPTIIVSHGLNGTGEDAKQLAGVRLARRGFAVCCFDFWGGSTRTRSGGEMWEMTPFTEQADLNAVIDYIKALDTTDTEKLFLLGESQGGFVTAITAAQRSKEIRAVVLYYPALCIPDDARARHGTLENIPEVEDFGGSKLGRALNEQVFHYDVYKVLPGYTGPVLIIHGDADQLVDLSYSQRAAETYANAELVCLSGEIHGFTPVGRKAAAEMSCEFLQRVLTGEELEEIITVNARLQPASVHMEGEDSVTTIPFTGTAKSKWFRGEVQPGAADIQRLRNGKTVRLCADYVLKGEDYTGKDCQIHIVNVDEGKGWSPTVTTDSEALSFLNGAECKLVLQGVRNVLTVRFLTKCGCDRTM